MSDYLDPQNEELLKDFFSEAQMQIDLLEQNILTLENDPSNKDSIDELFRAAHTLKGGSATVQMFELAEFTHVVEDVLDSVRSGSLSIMGQLVDHLLAAIDVVKAMVNARIQGDIYDDDVSSLVESFKSYLKPDAAPQAKASSSSSAQVAPPRSGTSGKASSSSAMARTTGGLSEYEILELKEAAENQPIYQVSVHFNEDNPMNTVGGIQIFAVLKELGTVLKTNPDFEKLYEDNFYPIVDYFLVMNCDYATLMKKTAISDVTTKVEIAELTEDARTASSDSGDSSYSTAPEVKSSQQPDPADSVDTEEQERENETDFHEIEQEIKKKEDPRKTAAVSSGSILRVDSKRIDNLLNLVSETVINKASFNQISNQFSQDLLDFNNTLSLHKDMMKKLMERIPELLEDLKKGTSIKDIKKILSEEFGHHYSLFDPMESRLKASVGLFRGTSQNLGRIIGELHEGVLRIRMVPISQIFSRFPRLVRDLSKTLEKKVDLIIEGEDTELDKSVIEDLLDPLIHCVRNSIDHGLEAPMDRLANRKPETGKVLLKASNEGNMIVIEISDDGRGIDVETIRKKAVDRGLIHPSKNLTDMEAFNLIFEPGFSTAKSITNISGRGVGLDVVRKQIEKLNGNVNIWSEKGKGTRFTIKLPLTLAIIQGLLVRVGKEIYAIPITSVIDSHRISPSDIKVIDNYEVFNVRKDVISLLRLNRLFGIPGEDTMEYNYVVVVGSGDKKMGLVVDSLIGEEDVVIKPLRDKYTSSPGIAGATILGDGKVSLIIDVSQLLDLGLRNERAEKLKRESRTR